MVSRNTVAGNGRTTAPPAAETILTYSASAGWGEAPSPIPPDGSTFTEDTLARAGYDLVCSWGEPDGFLHTQTYIGNAGDFLLHVQTGDVVHTIHVRDLPSYLDLAGKLLPVIQASTEMEEAPERFEQRCRARQTKTKTGEGILSRRKVAFRPCARG